jgi:tricorn protease
MSLRLIFRGTILTRMLLGAGLLMTSVSLWAQPAPAPARPHAGLLRYPSVSAKQIVFVYANKLWLVGREGGQAVPLATPPGSVRQPRFSPDGARVAFTGNYDGNFDLYTIPVEGGLPTRATHHPAAEHLCNWTPDGKLLFASNGLTGQARQDQLFTVSPNGGLPAKLPVPYGDDAAISPDGRYLAYTPSSTNNRTWKRYRGGWAQDIWLFDLQTKTAKKITDWEGTDTLPMWQGTRIYYLSDGGPEHRLNIWRYDTKSGQRQQITRLADYDVKWPSIGSGTKGTGEIIFEYGPDLQILDLASGKTRAVSVSIPGDQSGLRPRPVDVSKFVTSFSLSPSGTHVAIEARGDIWTTPVKDGTPRNLTHSSGAAERSPAWSPDGRWIAYLSDATGEYELYATQSDGRGETRQLTKNGSTFRTNVGWSPDSKYLTFADKTGALYLVPLAGGQAKLITTDPYARTLNCNWSPDSRWITYAHAIGRRQVGAIFLYNVETGKATQVTSGMFNDSAPVFDHKGDFLYFASGRSFNPQYGDDSTWIYGGTEILVAAPLRNDVRSPYLPKLEEEPFGDSKKTASVTVSVLDTPVTNLKASLAGASPSAPTASLVPAAPVLLAGDEVSGEWKGMAGTVSFTMRLVLGANNMVTGSITSAQGSGTVTGTYNPTTHEITLTAALEGGVTATISGKISGTTFMGTAMVMGMSMPVQAERTSPPAAPAPNAPAANGGKTGTTAAPATNVRIDLEGFEARAILLPARSGRFGGLAVNDRNQLLFARLSVPGSEEGAGLKLFDINDDKRQEQMIAAGASDSDITPDGKKILIARGPDATVQDATVGAAGETVITTGMTTTIDPRAEWKQLFVDAWRIERDFFYDPNMHGVNWKGMRDQYAKMLEDCATRDDVSYVISEMISELNVGHAYYSGGDVTPEPSVSVGMLGADYALENGAFRITKIYQGAPWDVDARGPLTQPGVKVREGDYLLAVNGTPLDATQDPWAAFANLAGRAVTITVSDKPKMDASAHDVAVRPVASEYPLRYRAWIEQNRKYVEQKTGGRVGYIYVPNTGIDGQNDLVRQFIAQYDKDALIIDERWNGGGQIPDRFIELLNRPVTNYWALRDGRDWQWPPVSHPGPKCMLINGLAGSGGDAFPWMFRQAKLGKLIGTRTWGGLVGISGNPGLIDGGGVTAPTFAFYKPNSTWGIEGHGVDPDIEVMDDPALMTNGGDPQLDAGIKQMLDELKRAPYIAPRRPSYPNKSGMGIAPQDK